MQRKSHETVIAFILFMMIILPFSVFAVESDTPSLPDNSNSGVSAGNATPEDSSLGVPALPEPASGRVRHGMRPGKKRGEHVATGVPAVNRGSFKNRANRRRDELVKKYEENQAIKGPEDGSLAGKQINTNTKVGPKGDAVGKPAWMDNNPLKPATNDPDAVTNTPPVSAVQDIASIAKTQPIAPGTGDQPQAQAPH